MDASNVVVKFNVDTSEIDAAIAKAQTLGRELQRTERPALPPVRVMLACVLLGCALSGAALLVREASDALTKVEARIDRIESFLQRVTQ